MAGGKKRKRSRQARRKLKLRALNLGYGVVVGGIALALAAGAVLRFYEEGDTIGGSVVVGCALYLAVAAAWLVRAAARKRG